MNLLTLQFQDHTSACEAIARLECRPSELIDCLWGWIVVRIEERLGIVEARFYPPQINYKEPPFEELCPNGRYDPATRPRAFVELEETLRDWREKYPDCLVMKLDIPPEGWSKPEFLQRQWARRQSFFDELRAIRKKVVPWPLQEFMDTEAVLRGLASSNTFGYLLLTNARAQLERAVRAGREPEEITKVHQAVRKLEDLGCKAGRNSLDQIHKVPGFAPFDEKAWLDRMRTECPGFSDWVYKGAIHHGFFMEMW
jgi:hypothetical protein